MIRSPLSSNSKAKRVDPAQAVVPSALTPGAALSLDYLTQGQGYASIGASAFRQSLSNTRARVDVEL